MYGNNSSAEKTEEERGLRFISLCDNNDKLKLVLKKKTKYEKTFQNDIACLKGFFVPFSAI